jgi:hypothetical protein
MEDKKSINNAAAHFPPDKAKEVQDILEQLVTHMLVKKPEDPVFELF